MISSKRKRKLTFQGQNYYWYIRESEEDIPMIHIISEDKTLRLEYRFGMGQERRRGGIGNHYIEELLLDYFEKCRKT